MRLVADRSGFTILELLVALIISALVAGSIIDLVSGQGRFVEMQSAREEVQQNTRAALELISSELRTLPAGGALVMAADDSITIRTARFWGVVCAVGGPTSLDVALPAIAGASYTTNTGTGAVVNLGDANAPVWSNAVSVSSIGGASGTCGSVTLGAGIERRTLSLGSQPQNSGDTPAVGDALYVYDQVTYRTGTSAAVPGLWIQRRVGDGAGGSNQPMAGPIDEGSGGLRFQYFAGTSAVPLSTPISDPAILETVNRVVVVVESVSRNSIGGDQESRADTVIVPLRNRV